MDVTDITVEILKSIREEIRETNQRLDQTKAELSKRIDRSTASQGEKMDELTLRMTEAEVRTATALTDLAQAVREVRELLANRLEIRDRVALCETEIARIKEHVGLGS